MAEKTQSPIMKLKKFFSTEEKPVSVQEMQEFWTSLTDAEKADYKAQVEALS